jgi:hypothetical protein
MSPTLSIETERLGAFANATEADLHRWVMEIGDGTEYVIVHREDDGLFAQAHGVPGGGGYVVEYAVADADLRQTTVATREEVYDVLAGWAFERDGWRDGRAWTVLTF